MGIETINQQILSKLSHLEKELGEIKEHMIDVDVIITEEELKLLNRSIENERKGKLVSLRDIENVRNKV